MEKIDLNKVDIVLSSKQKFGKFAVGAAVGYFASVGAEKLFDMAVVAIRSRKG